MTTANPGERRTESVRQLGFSEARMHAMHEHLSGTTDSTIAVQVSGRLELAELSAAIGRSAKRHGILGVAIAERHGHWHFVSADENPSPAISVVERRSKQTWQSLFRQLNSTAIDCTAGLVQWWLVTSSTAQEHELLVRFHHATLDGVGALSLLDEILGSLPQPACGNEAPRERELPPAAESAMSTVPFGQFVAAQASLMNGVPGTAYGGHPRQLLPMGERRTITEFLAISGEAVTEHRARCAAAGVSMSSMIAALLLEAVDSCGAPGAMHTLLTPFSLRRLCAGALAEDELGCYLSVIPTHHRIASETTTEQLAREHAAGLSRALVGGLKHPTVAPSVDELRAFVMKAPSVHAAVGPIPQTIGLSFLDRPMRRSFPGLTVTGLWGAANRAAGHQSIVVHGMVLSGQAHFTISHTESLVTKEWFASVVKSFSHRLGGSAVSKPTSDGYGPAVPASEAL